MILWILIMHILKTVFPPQTDSVIRAPWYHPEAFVSSQALWRHEQDTLQEATSTASQWLAVSGGAGAGGRSSEASSWRWQDPRSDHIRDRENKWGFIGNCMAFPENPQLYGIHDQESRDWMLCVVIPYLQCSQQEATRYGDTDFVVVMCPFLAIWKDAVGLFEDED